jgi:hypothetical protein
MSHLFGRPLTLAEGIEAAAVGLATASFALFLGRRYLGRAMALPAGSRPDMHLQSAMSGQDRRTAPRRRGNSIAAHLADDSDASPAEVWVMDRSLGGLCLLAEAPVEIGSRLRVRPVSASGSNVWTPIRVRGCNRDREGWLVRCQFLQVPPMNVLLLFG